MKYKILDVAPGQIKVEYEDQSWAIIPISPHATLEDIDHEVSKYDPDFIKKQEDVCNQDVYIGQERVSIRKENEEPTPIKVDPLNVPDGIVQKQVAPGLTSNRPFSLDRLAKYFAKKGDYRLEDLLDSFIEEYIDKSNVSMEQLIDEAHDSNPFKLTKIKMTDDELMAQAEAELEAELKDQIDK